MVHNFSREQFGSTKGYMLIETLITAGIILILLPAVYYGYEKILKDKSLDYFTTELTGIIESAQYRALTHGAMVTVLINNDQHQIIVREGMTTTHTYPFDHEITIEKVTLDLKLTIYSNGHFLGAGKWKIRLGDKSKFVVFNVGEGRFYVQG